MPYCCIIAEAKGWAALPKIDNNGQLALPEVFGFSIRGYNPDSEESVETYKMRCSRELNVVVIPAWPASKQLFTCQNPGDFKAIVLVNLLPATALGLFEAGRWQEVKRGDILEILLGEPFGNQAAA